MKKFVMFLTAVIVISFCVGTVYGETIRLGTSLYGGFPNPVDAQALTKAINDYMFDHSRIKAMTGIPGREWDRAPRVDFMVTRDSNYVILNCFISIGERPDFIHHLYVNPLFERHVNKEGEVAYILVEEDYADDFNDLRSMKWTEIDDLEIVADFYRETRDTRASKAFKSSGASYTWIIVVLLVGIGVLLYFNKLAKDQSDRREGLIEPEREGNLEPRRENPKEEEEEEIIIVNTDD